MEGLLAGKIALITGGASGLGRVLVRMFIEEGARVAFTYRNSDEGAHALEAEFGDKVKAYHADASDYELAQAVVSDVVSMFGGLDILVNNAASARGGSFLKISEEDMLFTLKNTFMPAFNYSRAVSEYFKKQCSGVILQIGSINGERGREGSAPYSAAKAAIEGMSKTIAKELGGFDIRCNVVAPGYIATDGQRDTSLLIQKLVLDECAIRRLTQPEEVGNLTVFLASDKAANITGQVYRIDCGQYM